MCTRAFVFDKPITNLLIDDTQLVSVYLCQDTGDKNSTRPLVLTSGF